MGNTGQACNSNKRMIVMDDIYDEFVAELTRQAEALTPGDPAAGAPGTFAPLSSRAAAEGLARQIQDAVEAGATLHAGGRLLEGPGAYLAPAVLTGITPDMAAHHQELFGPVAVVYRVTDDDEALALANDTPYGLGGAVFSTDPDRARRLAEGLDSGMAAVNAAEAEGAEHALRRGQALRVRPGAGPAGHGRVRQQAPAVRQRPVRRAGLTTGARHGSNALVPFRPLHAAPRSPAPLTPPHPPHPLEDHP